MLELPSAPQFQLPKGLFPPPGTGWVHPPPALALAPPSAVPGSPHSLPPVTSFLPNISLLISSILVCLARSCIPLGRGMGPQLGGGVCAVAPPSPPGSGAGAHHDLGHHGLALLIAAATKDGMTLSILAQLMGEGKRI